ncbi:carboxypeptidase regulatory-like domain-containing protein [Candidatus Fermentibacteria bacterium]|nr:carboxypeptidase regulatory-like domain-containing protein [Candidatus Fermentibacteria bacterium]
MKRSALFAAALVLVASTFSSLIASESMPAMRIVGEVVTENGKPVPGAAVHFTLVTGNGKQFTIVAETNQNGKYGIKDVPMSKGRGEVFFRDAIYAQPVAVNEPVNVVNFIL